MKLIGIKRTYPNGEVKIEQITDAVTDSAPISNPNIEYDDKGRIIYENMVSDNYPREHWTSYDENDNTTYSKTKWKSGQVMEEFWQYDSRNFNTYHKMIDTNGSILVNTFTYDDHGNQLSHHKNGVLSEESTYNEEGVLLTQHSYDGPYLSTFILKDNGHWTTAQYFNGSCLQSTEADTCGNVIYQYHASSHSEQETYYDYDVYGNHVHSVIKTTFYPDHEEENAKPKTETIEMDGNGFILTKITDECTEEYIYDN
jgi:hypothetical protein